jgi:hypothetical protein
MAFRQKKLVYVVALRFSPEERELIDAFFVRHPELLRLKSIKKFVLDAITREQGKGQK